MNNNDANTTINGKKIEVTIGSLLYSDKVLINLEDGYEIKDENGQLYAVKKRGKYPNTYEECCKVLGKYADMTYGYKKYVLHTLQMLLVCRDAYWQIAGQEMGLENMWEPDFTNDDEERYGIYTVANKVVKDFCGIGDVNTVLSFPTEEIRDVFYENFKKEIEICKELL